MMLSERFLTDAVTTNTKYHEGLYKVYYKNYNEEGHKDIKLCIDHATCSIMKLTVTDDRDPRFMFSLELTRDDYSILQSQQGLLVQFDAFPKQVVRLLEECSRGDMLLQLLQTAQSEWCLQFVVRNEFKSLVHLQLLIGRASDADLIKFMSNKVQHLTESLNKVHQTLLTKEDTYRRTIDQKDCDIQNLRKSLELMKLEIKRTETEYKRELATSIEHVSKERDAWQREQDDRYESKLNDLHSEIKRKKSDIEHMKSELTAKTDKIYSLENSMRDYIGKVKTLEQDLNTSRTELGALQNDLSGHQRDCMDRDAQIQSLRTRATDLERRLVLKDEQLSKANTSLTMLQQNIAEAESKVTDCMIKLNNKRENLQVTSQDLAKANEIILKQNEQINALKEKVKFRTAVAFEQEKVIEKIQCELSSSKNDNADLKVRLEESESKLAECIKETADLKTKLMEKDRTIEYNTTMINWMQKRINETTGVENSAGNPILTSGTGNMTSRSNHSTMFPTYRSTKMPTNLPIRNIGQNEPTSNRNYGQLSADLLLPNDPEETARTSRPLTQISSNIPRGNIIPGNVRPNSDKNSKAVSSNGSDTQKTTKLIKNPRRVPPVKQMSTPSNYFTNLT